MRFTPADAAEFLGETEDAVRRQAAAEFRGIDMATAEPAPAVLLRLACRKAASSLPPETGPLPRLSDALARGGIDFRATAGERRALLRGFADAFPSGDGPETATLLRGLLDWDETGCVAVGGGASVPHPSRPVISPAARPAVRPIFLAEPLDAAGPDGRPIDTLFLVVGPGRRVWLELLGQLAGALHDDGLFRARLLGRVPATRLSGCVRRAERSDAPGEAAIPARCGDPPAALRDSSPR
ncbi:MAG TPA: hypothetical protein VF170_08760 [Planctomycetaceae bacterium]